MVSDADGHFWACPKPDCDTLRDHDGDCPTHDIPLIECDTNGQQVTT